MNNRAECFHCRDLSNHEHQALRALYDGEADAYQQRLALKVITNVFARSHDLLYVPGSLDQSAFINGRAFVGQKILKYLNVPVGQMTEENNNVDQ